MSRPAVRPGRRWVDHWRLWLLVGVLLAGDLWTKEAAFAHHRRVQGVYGATQPLAVFDTGCCRVNLVREHNTGMAFGVLADRDAPSLLIVARILVVGALLVLLKNSPPQARVQRLAIAAVLAGALGNLADNLWTFDPTHPHAVRDFIHIAGDRWSVPAFNFADTLVTAGGILLICSTLRRRRPATSEGSR
jgi:lipoprotein signal peptidase